MAVGTHTKDREEGSLTRYRFVGRWRWRPGENRRGTDGRTDGGRASSLTSSAAAAAAEAAQVGKSGKVSQDFCCGRAAGMVALLLQGGRGRHVVQVDRRRRGVGSPSGGPSLPPRPPKLWRERHGGIGGGTGITLWRSPAAWRRIGGDGGRRGRMSSGRVGRSPSLLPSLSLSMLPSGYHKL